MTRDRFLLLQLRPEDAAADHEARAIRSYAGLPAEAVERIRVEQAPVTDLDPHAYAGIIVGGSPFDVTTPEAEKSALQSSVEAFFLDLLAEVVAHDIPFFGACSGNGLLGTYLGAPMSRQYAEPVGGTTVEMTEAGQRDPLLAGLPGSFRVLTGHKEACDETPPGASLLLSNASCPVQMFRVGNNVYATQFHPEGDTEGFFTRIQTYKHYGYFAPETADELMERVAREHTPVPHEILHRFAARYGGS